MRICSFYAPNSSEPRCGVVEGEVVVEVTGLDTIGFLAKGLSGETGRRHDLSDLRLLAPVPRPPSIRDFFVFEQHVATARGKRGLPVPDFWYNEPVFYFTNPAAVIASEDPLPFPLGTAQLDYELELAAIVGAGGSIAGFTIMNDWSARDIQRQENTVGLGPAKAKDFATTIGPHLVTVDEFAGTHGAMVALVNGEERSRGQVEDMHHSWASIVERASRNTELRPGDVLGSGTVGTGCILESVDEIWLQVGDVVTLEIEGLGAITNQVYDQGQRP